mgnify:CR=1 FL=1
MPTESPIQRSQRRMRLAWDRYWRDTPLPPMSKADILSLMMSYASRIVMASGGPFVIDLAGVAFAAKLLLPGRDVLALALEEYGRAAKKHPGMTLECDGHTDATRLFALVEEIGEVAACLTYDNDAETGHGSDLESEAIQVIALALAWATRYLDD